MVSVQYIPDKTQTPLLLTQSLARRLPQLQEIANTPHIAAISIDSATAYIAAQSGITIDGDALDLPRYTHEGNHFYSASDLDALVANEAKLQSLIPKPNKGDALKDSRDIQDEALKQIEAEESASLDYEGNVEEENTPIAAKPIYAPSEASETGSNGEDVYDSRATVVSFYDEPDFADPEEDVVDTGLYLFDFGEREEPEDERLSRTWVEEDHRDVTYASLEEEDDELPIGHGPFYRLRPDKDTGDGTDEDRDDAPQVQERRVYRGKEKQIDQPDYVKAHNGAMTAIVSAGEGPLLRPRGRRKIVLPAEQDRLFCSEDSYATVGALETTLHRAYAAVSPSNIVHAKTHQHDLSSIILGDGIVDFLVLGELFPFAHAYVHALYVRATSTKGNIWPLADARLQKKKGYDGVAALVETYEVYKKTPSPQALVALMKAIPRLARGYVAAVGWHLNDKKKDWHIKDDDDDWQLRPVYHYGWNSLENEIRRANRRRVGWKRGDPEPQLAEGRFGTDAPLLLSNRSIRSFRALLGQASEIEKLVDRYDELKELRDLDPEARAAHIKQTLLTRYAVLTAHSRIAHDLMWVRNRPLAISRAKGYRRSLGWANAVGEAEDGLRDALIRFDYTRGWKFSTYATWWIRQKLTRAVDSHRLVRYPVYIAELIKRLGRAEDSFIDNEGRDPTEEELAEELDWDLPKVRKILGLRSGRGIKSLDAPLGDGPRSSNFGDLIEDEGVVHADVRFGLAQQIDRMYDLIHLADLERKEIDILGRRKGLPIHPQRAPWGTPLDSLGIRERKRAQRMYSGWTPGDVQAREDIGSAALDLTGERIRQIEAKAIRKLTAAAMESPAYMDVLSLIVADDFD